MKLHCKRKDYSLFIVNGEMGIRLDHGEKKRKTVFLKKKIK